jgi:hypothetical protein
VANGYLFLSKLGTHWGSDCRVRGKLDFEDRSIPVIEGMILKFQKEIRYHCRYGSGMTILIAPKFDPTTFEHQ